MVECPLSKRAEPGSMPGFSNNLYFCAQMMAGIFGNLLELLEKIRAFQLTNFPLSL